MRTEHRRWLEAKDYNPDVIRTLLSRISRAEQDYGDLDALYSGDRLESVLASLKYTSEDARRGVPNPSKINIGGDFYNGLASYKSTVALYRRFLDETGDVQAGESPVNTGRIRSQETDPGQRVGLERDLQKALRREIEQLEPGLTIIDEGVERYVPSGYIDITARDRNGNTVVIELKAGTADRAAVGQILSYMGDVAEEDSSAVRGLLVAHDFDAKSKAAARMVPNLGLRSYAVRFAFLDPVTKSEDRT